MHLFCLTKHHKCIRENNMSKKNALKNAHKSMQVFKCSVLYGQVLGEQGASMLFLHRGPAFNLHSCLVFNSDEWLQRRTYT